ncbi:hypothetical protein JNUCC42_19915 [Brevibacterium sp. JNUCC-42]|nr:hypothetical protein JNUCC42_19915 [Brevibacterium sp. JNUCC-42]
MSNQPTEVAQLFPIFPITKPMLMAYCHYQDSGILKLCNVDLEKGEIEILFTSPSNVAKLSIAPSQKVAYGVELEGINHSYKIVFYKIFLEELRVEKIVELPANEYVKPEMERVSLSDIDSYVSDIYSLNDQYAIFFLSNQEVIYGKAYFNQAFLIDSSNFSISKINPELNYNDSLLRVDHIKSFQRSNNDYFYLKTGRIYPAEKRSMWQEFSTKAPYFDHFESIILFQTSDFIKQIQNECNQVKGVLLEQVDFNSCLKDLDVVENQISYIVNHIPTDTHKLILHDIISGNRNETTDKNKLEDYKARDITEEWLYEDYIINLQNTDNASPYHFITSYNHFNVYVKQKQK